MANSKPSAREVLRRLSRRQLLQIVVLGTSALLLLAGVAAWLWRVGIYGATWTAVAAVAVLFGLLVFGASLLIAATFAMDVISIARRTLNAVRQVETDIQHRNQAFDTYVKKSTESREAFVAEVGLVRTDVEIVQRALAATLSEMAGTLRHIDKRVGGDHMSEARFSESNIESLLEELRSHIAETHVAPRELSKQLHDQHVFTVRSVTAQVEALLAIHSFLRPKVGWPLPAFDGWSVAPDLAAYIIRMVVYSGRRDVLELGSGISTLLVALAFESADQEGTIVSLEHDPYYLEQTRQQLTLFDVERFVELHHAPLVRTEIRGQSWQWYDLRAANLEGRQFDLLLVDGPPQKVGPHARYPAMPLLESYLSSDSVVLLDDGNRPEEREVMDKWATEFPQFRFERLGHLRGTIRASRSR